MLFDRIPICAFRYDAALRAGADRDVASAAAAAASKVCFAFGDRNNAKISALKP